MMQSVTSISQPALACRNVASICAFAALSLSAISSINQAGGGTGRKHSSTNHPLKGLCGNQSLWRTSLKVLTLTPTHFINKHMCTFAPNRMASPKQGHAAGLPWRRDPAHNAAVQLHPQHVVYFAEGQLDVY
jgi:hypothetical protein